VAALDDLVSALTPGAEDITHRRIGQVTAIYSHPSGVDVTIDGKTPAYPKCNYLASYSPTVGDFVVCLMTGVEVIVLGALAKS
jgi:hypothetical protein